MSLIRREVYYSITRSKIDEIMWLLNEAHYVKVGFTNEFSEKSFILMCKEAIKVKDEKIVRIQSILFACGVDAVR